MSPSMTSSALLTVAAAFLFLSPLLPGTISSSHYQHRSRHHRETTSRRLNTVSSSSSSRHHHSVETVLTYSNGTVFLGCDLASPDIEWRRDGTKVHIDEEERFTSSFLSASSRHVLKISPVAAGDTGSWNCHTQAGGETVVGDGDGSGGGDKKTGGHLSEAESEKSWKLIVLPGIERVFAFQESEGGRGDSRRLVSGPSVVSASSYDSDAVSTESSSSIGIDEGDDVRVACAMIVRKQNVRDAAKNVLKWTSKTAGVVSSSDLGSGQETLEYFVQNNDDVLGFLAVLRLSDVNRTMNGADLSCSAHFGVASLSLEVHYPPTFTLKRTPGFGIPVVEGMTLSLQCLVDVYPQTFGSWLKDEERLPSPTSRASSNGTVVFDEIRPEDSGWFQCFVMYDGEEYTSIAYFLSVKRIERRKKEEEAHSDVDMADNGGDKADPEKFTAALSSGSESGLGRSSDDAPYDVRAFDRIDLVGEDDEDGSSSGISESVIFSESGMNCSGILNSPHFKGGPSITSLNGSMVHYSVINGDQSARLAFRVCSNPKPSRVIWATPVYALRPGQSRGGFVAGNMTRTDDDITCYLVTIDVSGESLFGEYVLVAGNDHGVSDQLIELRRPATDIRSYTSGAQRRTSYPQSAAFSSFVVFAIYVLRRL